MSCQWKTIVILCAVSWLVNSQRTNVDENDDETPQVWETKPNINTKSELTQPSTSETDFDIIGNRGSFLTIVTPEPIDEVSFIWIITILHVRNKTLKYIETYIFITNLTTIYLLNTLFDNIFSLQTFITGLLNNR